MTMIVKIKKPMGNFLRVRPANIPKELKRLSKWVCWRAQKKGDSWTKIPIHPISKQAASILNPDDWTDFSTAYRSFINNGLDGIGFVLTEDDSFVGIDIDGCVDPKTGEIQSWVKLIVKYLGCYTEFSPSGKGIRIFVIGKLPPGRRKKKHIEFYDSKRYLTVTGQHFEGTPTKIHSRKKEIIKLHSMIFTKTLESKHTVNDKQDYFKILQIAFRSKNGAKIKRLFEGDFSGYDSQSEADLAFCAHLSFWFGRDAEMIDKVVRASKLFRKKWDTLHGSKTYGQMTIQEAIQSTTDVYQPPKIKEPIIPEILTARELIDMELPKMRWLVRDLLPEGLILLAGKPKIGKSWLAFQLCVSIACKRPFIGNSTKRVTVMYLSLEDSYLRLQSRLIDLLQGKNPPKNLYLSKLWPDMDDDGLGHLEREIQKKKLKFVVIDTFQKFRPKSSGKRNIYEIDSEDIGSIKRIADKYRITILLVHHLRKADADDPIDTVLGSTGLTGSADGTIILERDRGSLNAALNITGRDLEERKMLLVFDEKATTWSYVGEADAHYRSKERQDIIDVIKDEDRPMGPKEISERLGLPKSKYPNIRKLVSKMFKSGELVKENFGKYDVRNGDKKH